MNVPEARARFAAASVARLATVSAHNRPHLVPITFALAGPDTIVTAVDHKPKRTTALRRLANIRANPGVSLLVDHYGDDWAELWWARADGTAIVLEPDDDPAARAAAVEALEQHYDAYRERPPSGAIIVVSVRRWSGWAATG